MYLFNIQGTFTIIKYSYQVLGKYFYKCQVYNP